jgi:hypothetical protein
VGKILRDLPFSAADSVATVGRERVRVKAHQIIVWVSVNMHGVLDPGNAPRFPAILDTGHTHYFSIQEQHLINWAGIRPQLLHVLGSLREGGRRVPLRAAHLWIHPNRRGKRDEFTNEPPVRLEFARGIAVYPDDGSNFPRLPLLGLRALAENALHLTIDGRKRSVSLRTAGAWWPFS